MLSDRGESQLEPTVMMLGDVLDEIARGRLRVPRFQRPFVWRPEQMIDLFDSIERGYPVGSILIWETVTAVSSLDSVGDVGIELPPTDRPISYILDGHQRLSTLFGVLRRQGRAPRPDDATEWKWRIYRNLEAELGDDAYRHHRAQGSPPQRVPVNYLPIRLVNSTIDFLRFSRNLELGMQDGARLERLIEAAEMVAQRIRGYKITMIRMRGGTLDEAVDVYTRLNRTATKMEADQVVSALTHRPNRPTMGEAIDDILESVASTGFGELPRSAVFRSMLAIAGERDVMSPRWERIADRLQGRIGSLAPETGRAVHQAVAFLQKDARLPLASLLPYAHQMIVLAAFFHRCPEPVATQRYELIRWFWVTSWATLFAGANSTMLRRSIEEIHDLADGRISRLALDTTAVQPIPESFNLNSARTLAYVAWEADTFPVRLNPLGQKFEVVTKLAGGAPQAYRMVVPKDSRAANRLVLPTVNGTGLLSALRDLPMGSDLFGRGYGFTRDLLASHGIPESAWQRLLEGDTDLFIEERSAYLAARLREFARGFGVPLGPDMVGVADDDTDHD